MVTSLITACATPQVSCDKKSLSVILVGENSESDNVAFDGQVFNRVSASLASNLAGKGYKVNDARQLMKTYPEYFDREVIEHKDASLTDLVRSLKGPSIDLIAIVSINSKVHEKQYHTNVTSGIDIRLLDVSTAKRIDNFAIDSSSETSIRPNCKDECLDQAIVDNARPITLEVATVINEKLQCAGGGNRGFDNSSGGFSTAYSIVLDGFTTAEAHTIENYLEEFGGYESLRVTYSGERRAEYWYQTSMKSAVLNRNINKILQAIDVRGLVQFSGNTYNVKKISLRGKQPNPQKVINKNDW
jgi:hypothetical protein